ncbi:hypothetical protein Tco_0252225 [Tanacetum coccineum]
MQWRAEYTNAKRIRCGLVVLMQVNGYELVEACFINWFGLSLNGYVRKTQDDVKLRLIRVKSEQKKEESPCLTAKASQIQEQDSLRAKSSSSDGLTTAPKMVINSPCLNSKNELAIPEQTATAWFIRCVFRGILKYSLTNLDVYLKRIIEPDTTWTNMGVIENVYQEVSGAEGLKMNRGIQWFEEPVEDVQEV